MNPLLQLLFDQHISINVSTLCVGYELGYIQFEEFKNYSLIKYLSDTDITLAIQLNLFEARNSYELKKILDKILQNNIEYKLEKEKWLYTVLQSVKNTEFDEEALLLKISEVYADFYYPPSMNDIIYYLPPTNDYDPTKHTLEENRIRLIKSFENYLKTLHKIIISKKI